MDIVTGAKAVRRETYAQKGVAVLASATGDAQRVLHVDNTAASGGDGSKGNPFNTLKAAEAALQAHDVIYVHRGDGTTAGQDEGIVIAQEGVSLIGSGTNFVYDGGKFTAASGKDYSGILLAARTSAPVITNTEAAAAGNGTTTGNGIYGLTDDVSISGLSIIGATGNGVFVNGTVSGSTERHVDISDMYISGSGRQGLRVTATQAAMMINEVYIHDVVSENNTDVGITVQGRISRSMIEDSESSHNGQSGFYMLASGTAYMDEIVMRRLIANGNGSRGYYIQAQATNGTTNINNVHISNVSASLNGNGLGFDISSVAAPRLNSITVENSNFSNNTTGVNLYVRAAAILGSASFDGLTVENNTQDGFYIHSLNGNSAIQDPVVIRNSSIVGNQRYGVYIDDESSPNGSPFAAINMGDGTNGTGHNSIYGNSVNDMVIDLDTGAVSAQGNWWGQAGGPLAGQIVSEAACPNCGTADTSNQLDNDPNL